MGVTAFASGTQACTVGTEHFVADVNAAGVFQFVVDISPLQAGDQVELRFYQMVLAGGTPREVYRCVFGPEAKVQTSLPLSNELTDATALRASIKQTIGTGRSLAWKVLKH